VLADRSCRRRHRGMGDRSPTSKKFFRLATLAIIIPPTSESESAPAVTGAWVDNMDQMDPSLLLCDVT
jgi:hypothetical protein